VRGFLDRKAGIEFCILAIATFLCFTSVSQTALLALVMKRHDMPLRDIGIVLSAYGAAVIVFMLAAAPIAARLGNLWTLRLGILFLVAGHLSYQATIADFPAAVASRLVQGVGYGLFMPTAMTFAKGKLTAERFVYLFGIFSSMVPLPNAIGPPLAEAYLSIVGERLFFVVGAAPAIVAGVLTLALSEDRRPGAARGLPLLATALLPGLRWPLIAILVVGVMYGLIPSYMAALLAERSVPIGFFFTSFTVVLFGARFLLLGYFEAWSRGRVVALGLALMAAAYAIVAEARDPVLVTLAGILYGLGYSMAYPVLSVWVAEQFEPQRRTTPVAVFNTAFSLGILLTPWFGTYVIAALGYEGLLYVLAGAGGAVAASLFLARRAARPLARET
jgi:MFS family permease